MSRHRPRNRARSVAVLAALLVATPSAATFALTPELAKKCRDLAITVYPYQLPGTGPGNARNEINFFKDCVAKSGNVDLPRKETGSAPNRN